LLLITVLYLTFQHWGYMQLIFRVLISKVKYTH